MCVFKSTSAGASSDRLQKTINLITRKVRIAGAPQQRNRTAKVDSLGEEGFPALLKTSPPFTLVKGDGEVTCGSDGLRCGMHRR